MKDNLEDLLNKEGKIRIVRNVYESPNLDKILKKYLKIQSA